MLREKWGPFGGLAVAFSHERQTTASWAAGAGGEERVGAALDKLDGDDIRVLHDRRIPRTRANIDHIVVTSDGVWVIDAKKYKGRPARIVEGGLFRPRAEKLLVGRRDKTTLIGGVVSQVARVADAVPGTPVRGVLCFVEADWPLFGGAFTIGGVDVLWPRELVARVSRVQGGGCDVASTAAAIASVFRPA